MLRKLHFYYIVMKFGGWENLDIVSRYTRSVKFEESLKLYQAIR
jgi:hypothetical protein